MQGFWDAWSITIQRERTLLGVGILKKSLGRPATQIWICSIIRLTGQRCGHRRNDWSVTHHEWDMMISRALVMILRDQADNQSYIHTMDLSTFSATVLYSPRLLKSLDHLAPHNNDAVPTECMISHSDASQFWAVIWSARRISNASPGRTGSNRLAIWMECILFQYACRSLWLSEWTVFCCQYAGPFAVIITPSTLL